MPYLSSSFSHSCLNIAKLKSVWLRVTWMENRFVLSSPMCMCVCKTNCYEFSIILNAVLFFLIFIFTCTNRVKWKSRIASFRAHFVVKKGRHRQHFSSNRLSSSTSSTGIGYVINGISGKPTEKNLQRGLRLTELIFPKFLCHKVKKSMIAVQ